MRIGFRRPAAETEAEFWARIRAEKQQADADAEAAKLAAQHAPRHVVHAPEGYWARVREDRLAFKALQKLLAAQAAATVVVRVGMSPEYRAKIKAERAASLEPGSPYLAALTLAQAQLEEGAHGIHRARHSDSKAITHSRYNATYGNDGRWFNTVQYGAVLDDGTFLPRLVEVQTGGNRLVHGRFRLDSMGFVPLDLGCRPTDKVTGRIFESYCQSLLNREAEVELLAEDMAGCE